MIVVTKGLEDGLLEEVRRNIPTEDTKVVVVAPAVEETVFHHALGDSDHARRVARDRLGDCLEKLRGNGVSALGQVGPSDPVLAASEAMQQYPADEVLIVTHPAGSDRWYEEGLSERAKRALHTPVRLIGTS